MSHEYELTFPDFKAATMFCRWMRCGVVTPQSVGAGFVWRSEGHPLDESQQSKYDAYIGGDSVWRDKLSGLTWMNSSAYESLYFLRFELGLPFAGFSDWRWPTLTELKTLRSSSQDKKGLWRIPALEGRIGPVLRSKTVSRFDRDERVDWDFVRDCACEESHQGSQIVWGSEGEYAGMENGNSTRTGAVNIFVRGTDSTQRPTWLQQQIQWAEEHRVDNFPVTEQSIGRLTELQVNIDNLPPYLDRLVGLRSLDIRRTGLFGAQRRVPAARQAVCLPSEVGALKNLQKLSVNGPIEVVPESICELINLEELDLGGAFTTLPAGLGRLMELRTLRVRSHRMGSLPPSIGQLSALTELCVHSEELRSLPEELGLLRALVRLDISGCSLHQLPGQMENLAQLEELNLSFNPLSALPLELRALKSIKWLNLCGVPIVEVPVALREMPSLEYLILDGTQIEEVPQWLWEMKSLRRLSLAHTWKLPRLPKPDRPTLKVDYHSAALDQPWGREWLQKMGKLD